MTYDLSPASPQRIELSGREHLSVSGVEDVDRFDENEIVMNTNDFVSLSGDRLALRSIENTDDYLWPEGIFNLAGHNFGEIIARLESLYGVTIAIEKTASPELNIIRGKIPVAMGLDYALRALQKITPFEYESADNGTITIR